MKLSIVYQYNLVVIDRVCQVIELDKFDLPENFHALQWSGDSGSIEYNDYSTDKVTVLPDWANNMVNEFNRLRFLNQKKISEEEKQSLSKPGIT